MRSGRRESCPLRARRPREAPAPPAASRPPDQLRRFDWFRKLLPATATALAATLIELMQRPEMIALVAAAPQAGRILRPMCWMVGIEPAEYLRLPPRPRRPGRSVAERPSPRPCPSKREAERSSPAGEQEATPLPMPAVAPPEPGNLAAPRRLIIGRVAGVIGFRGEL
jgi:hypothetical protein